MMVEVLNNHAVLQSDEKKYEEAEATFRKGLCLRGRTKTNRQELSALASLGGGERAHGATLTKRWSGIRRG